MTIGQSDVLRYIRTEFPGAKTEEVGESVIRVTDQDGKKTDFSINIFGDILENLPDGSNRIIAVSDLPHNLDKLPIYARAKTWTKKGV